MLFEKPKTARIFVYAALLGGLLAAPVRAEEVKAGDLVITQDWSRATPGGAKIATGYLTIENKGSTPDRLIGGSADVASKVEVHEMATKNDVMTMRPLDNGLTIEPDKTVKLAPGGYHLMLLACRCPFWYQYQNARSWSVTNSQDARSFAASSRTVSIGFRAVFGSPRADRSCRSARCSRERRSRPNKQRIHAIRLKTIVVDPCVFGDRGERGVGERIVRIVRIVAAVNRRSRYSAESVQLPNRLVPQC